MLASHAQWQVLGVSKQLWVQPPELQGLPDQVEFPPSVSQVIQQRPDASANGIGSILELALERPQHPQPNSIVHGSAVVRVDQGEVPQVIALINVGNSRSGE